MWMQPWFALLAADARSHEFMHEEFAQIVDCQSHAQTVVGYDGRRND